MGRSCYYAPDRAVIAYTLGKTSKCMVGCGAIMPARSLLLLVPFIVMSQIGKGASSPQRAPFGTMPDGKPVEQFTLTNARGLEVKAISYGGIITSLRVPDRNGRLDDIVLGFESLDGYLKNDPFFGAIIGRYGNRIGKGQFALDGKTYKLATNNGPNHLHGGNKGLRQGALDRGADRRQQRDRVYAGRAPTAKKATRATCASVSPTR